MAFFGRLFLAGFFSNNPDQVGVVVIFTPNSSHHVLSTITTRLYRSGNFASLTALLLTDIEDTLLLVLGKVIKEFVSDLQQESSIPLSWYVLREMREHGPEI